MDVLPCKFKYHMCVCVCVCLCVCTTGLQCRGLMAHVSSRSFLLFFPPG